MNDQWARLLSIFMPTRIKAFTQLRDEGGKLAHYTSAANAMNILRGEEVWLRNARMTNDPYEVTFGADGALAAYRSTEGQRFRRAFEAVVPDEFVNAVDTIDSWDEAVRTQSFITSLCIHVGRENERGRLFMLEKYGGPTGVALILNNRPFTSFTDALGVYSTAVDYVEPDGFVDRVARVADAIETNAEFLKACHPGFVQQVAFQMFFSSMLCVKHAGWIEEREWRVFHVPGLSPRGATTMATEQIRGKTESVYKVPLREPLDEDLGVSIPAILHRVVIGPMANREAVRDEFVALLTEKGVQNAHQQVVLSDTAVTI
jgi:hypothetical protein